MTLSEKLDRAEAALAKAARLFERAYHQLQLRAKRCDRAHADVGRLTRRVNALAAEIERALVEGTGQWPAAEG